MEDLSCPGDGALGTAKKQNGKMRKWKHAEKQEEMKSVTKSPGLWEEGSVEKPLSRSVAQMMLGAHNLSVHILSLIEFFF